MKAIIYCRKSTESSERQIQSLEAQKKYCIDYAKQYWFSVVKIIEESKSAKQPWRKWFNEMLSIIWQKEAEYIICWDLSRLCRNPIDQWTIVWLTQQWLIKQIYSTNWVVDGSNILLMNIHFWMSNQYIVELKKNVLRWMLQKFEKWWALWQAPTWYWNNKNTNEYEIDKIESEHVKEIFRLKAKKYTYPQISKILYTKWFKSRTWKPKAPSTLEQIIRNEFYVWIIKFQWKTTDWKHQTFISKKLFDEANWFRKTSKINSDIDHNEFIFSWLLKYQWKAMRAYKTKNNIYYREWTWIKPSFNISQKVLIEKMEDELPNYVLPDCLKDEFSSWLIKYFDEMNKWNKKDIIQTRKKIDELKEENKTLVRKNVRWQISDEILWEMQKENLLQIKDLEEKLSDLSKVDELIDWEVVELFKMFTDSQKVWKNTNLYSKALLLKILLVELNFDNKKQLNIQNTKLFSLIRDINFTLWQSH